MILSFPGQVASYSATELAALAGVSKAAASRLVRKLGFDTFEAMRHCARTSQRWGSPHYLNTAASESRTFEEAVRAHVACETENIRATLSGLSATVAEAVEALAHAPRVGCLGFRRSRVVADYLRWALVQVRRDVRAHPHDLAVRQRYCRYQRGPLPGLKRGCAPGRRRPAADAGRRTGPGRTGRVGNVTALPLPPVQATAHGRRLMVTGRASTARAPFDSRKQRASACQP